MNRLIKWPCAWWLAALFAIALPFAQPAGAQISVAEQNGVEWTAQHMPVSENLVVRFFADAELQVETRQQLREIQRALNDALTLPVAELRARRYADYTMTADRWTFGMLISAYFLSEQPINPELDEFYADSKQPEAAEVLAHWLSEVTAAIPDGAGD